MATAEALVDNAAAPARRRELPPLEVWLALAFLAFLAVATIAPSVIAPGDPLETSLLATLKPPSAEHWFGTDRLGRDVFTRVVHGAQYSIMIGVSATVLALTIGIALGLVAGVSPRLVDEAISRTFDIVGAFPELLFALVLIAFAGPSTSNLIFAIGFAAAPRYGRVIRAETLAIRNAEYVHQSRLITRSALVRTLRHILPNALGTVPILATLGVGTAILGASSLSFLGFGPEQPLPEWGSSLAEARGDVRIAWWSATFPGLFVTATVISVTLVGRYLQRRFERRELL